MVRLTTSFNRLLLIMKQDTWFITTTVSGINNAMLFGFSLLWRFSDMLPHCHWGS